jgi:hypothetical protein
VLNIKGLKAGAKRTGLHDTQGGPVRATLSALLLDRLVPPNGSVSTVVATAAKATITIATETFLRRRKCRRPVSAGAASISTGRIPATRLRWDKPNDTEGMCRLPFAAPRLVRGPHRLLVPSSTSPWAGTPSSNDCGGEL